jgi:hypothetical protein
MTVPSCRLSRSPARALALAVAFAAAGCATAPKFKPTDSKNPKAYKFTIGFSGSPECPTSATPDWANCRTDLDPNARGQPKDCTWVPYDATVELAGPDGKSFGLQFDPFGRSSIPVTGTTGPLSVPKDAAKPHPTDRHYTFRVTAEGCKPLDPEIIVNW